MGLLNPGGPIAQFKRNDCSISPVEVILRNGVRKKVSDPDEVDDILLELAVFSDHYAPARDLFREVSLKIIHRQPPFCALESVWVKSIREAAIQMSEGECHL